MNLLFLTLLDFHSLNEHNIYTDLLREFQKNGHRVYVISPSERRNGEKTRIIQEKNANILKLRIGNTQKTNLIEKGISTLTIEPIFINGIKKYFSNVKFDLVMYSTPPITLCKAIEYVKKRDRAKTYLLLKDIFPQNAVDLGMMKTTGIKGLLYQYFRNKEKKLYAISDHIGCMSPANVEYVLKHNPEIDPKRVEVCPNCIEVVDKSVDAETRKQIRKKYQIPDDKMVFVYGGNLGKPQGIDFLIDCLRSQKNNQAAFFLIIGDGTEYGKLKAFTESEPQENVRLMQRLPKEDYDTLVGACDVGMIFLDHRFTIPNFPSRLLSYMQAKIPVLACTDPNTDIGKVITEGGFGWWCESDDAAKFVKIAKQVCNQDFTQMQKNEEKFLNENYTAEMVYKKVNLSFEKKESFGKSYTNNKACKDIK